MFKIRKAELSDTDNIYTLAKTIFGDEEYDNDFIYSLLQTCNYNYVAEYDKNIIGFILSCDDDNDSGPEEIDEYMFENNLTEILTIICFGVDENYRGKQIGSKLLNTLINEIKNKVDRLALQVSVSNLVAQRMYEKAGFKSMIRIKDYYTDPVEDCFFMIKLTNPYTIQS